MYTIYLAGGCLWGVQSFLKTVPGVVETEALLQAARDYINSREDKERIVVEVLALNNYVRSADEHQDYLDRHPEDYCHVPLEMMRKYK
ncbi:peptide-methionine (S)-S-oxide reductase [Macrococcus armenti]|uniref:peptide-methionine (S)-S-oxide reductase n=1 Tax=Macrococcus armenti TaxID=2875764 RepID=A0ABY3ZY86_9STAP|nr:peptide-methionine (S)-S-oxide reductase [Macrococcus armenti]UOB20801.1 peptide-methionine (S)-S-oxide reductase [Macrococcus armenti]